MLGTVPRKTTVIHLQIKEHCEQPLCLQFSWIPVNDCAVEKPTFNSEVLTPLATLQNTECDLTTMLLLLLSGKKKEKRLQDFPHSP